jgi:hypothetical protein
MRGLSGPPSSGVRQAERAGVEARATGRNLRIHLIDSLPSSAKSHGQDVSKNDESARGKLQKFRVGGDSGHSGVAMSGYVPPQAWRSRPKTLDARDWVPSRAYAGAPQ